MDVIRTLRVSESDSVADQLLERLRRGGDAHGLRPPLPLQGRAPGLVVGRHLPWKADSFY